MENRLSTLFVFVCLMLSAACSQMVPEPVEESGTDIKLVLDASIDRWDAGATKAGESSAWKGGNRIFFLIDGVYGKTNIEAWYDESSNTWNLEKHAWFNYDSGWAPYQVDINWEEFTSGNCEAYFFANRNDDDDFNREYTPGDLTHYLTVNPTTAIYRDPEAVYSMVDGVLTLKAHLTPMTGRIRFARPEGGDDYYYVGLFGLKHFTKLDLQTFEWITTTNLAETYLNGGDVYTDYFYGVFEDPDRRVITVADRKYGDPDCYERTFTEDIFTPGSSNWSYMPMADSHNEWYRFDGAIDGGSFGVGGLRMLYVVPGRFMMGGEDVRPIHQVTLTQGYYLSQTEITKDMWYQVMGEPSEYANAAVPVTDKSWDEVQAFIAALNAKSGYSFRLPTEAEWEFAARGGLQSKGYKYSGSDSYSDVAVQDGNWSMQATKTKNPNEWNFYDMSGNAAEWVSDWYAPYPTEAVVDPKGPDNGTEHITRGGSRGRDPMYLTVSYRDHEPERSLTGFRLALDASKIR